MRRALIAATLLLGGSSALRPGSALAQPRADAAAAAPAARAADAGAPARPAEPTASDRVRAQLDAAVATPGDEAAWFPFRIFEAVARVTGELPSSTAPSVRGDRVVWSLVANATAERRSAEPWQRACDEVARLEPRIVCAVDTTAVGATDRTRVAFGWRRGAGEVPRDLAVPLRALSRLQTGACVVSVERTLHTLDLTLQFDSQRALGTSLALLAVAPHLTEMLLVRSEQPNPPAVRATLSWPTDRVERAAGDLGADAFPPRCGGAAAVGAGVAPRSRVTALTRIGGERAQGAVLNLARREWVVAEGDRVGDVVVTQVGERGVYVRRVDRPRARPTLLRYAAPAADLARAGALAARVDARAADPERATPGRMRPPRVPLPPEPPAPVPARRPTP